VHTHLSTLVDRVPTGSLCQIGRRRTPVNADMATFRGVFRKIVIACCLSRALNVREISWRCNNGVGLYMTAVALFLPFSIAIGMPDESDWPLGNHQFECLDS